MTIKNDNLGKKIGYQIFPLSFKSTTKNGYGDIKGIIFKLDYLKELGIDIIWLCPIYKSDFIDAGYDVIDYYKIDPKFGTISDFELLIQECQNRDIDLMMDIVLNHSSNKTFEFQQACLSKNNQYYDFYIWNDKPNLKDQSVFGGSAWEYVDKVKSYYLHIFSKNQPDFNYENADLRKSIYNIFYFWIKKGVKYFRLDAAEHIGKTTDPYIIRYGEKNKKYLQELKDEIFKKHNAYFFSESWNVDIDKAREYSEDSKIVDAFFNFSLIALDWQNKHGALALKKNDVNFVDLISYFNWQKEKILTATFWTNHDVPRAIDRYFKFNQKNHYYIQTLLSTLILTTKGIPFLFQGEEFGMLSTKLKIEKDFRDVNFFSQQKHFLEQKIYTTSQFLKAAITGSRDLCRSVMAWDNSENSGFSENNQTHWINKSKKFEIINCQKDLKNKKSIYHYTKNLIKLRKNNFYNFFCNFDQIELLSCKKDFIEYCLIYNKEKIYVLLNFSDQKIMKKPIKFKKLIFSNYLNNNLKEIKPYEATIYKI